MVGYLAKAAPCTRGSGSKSWTSHNILWLDGLLQVSPILSSPPLPFYLSCFRHSLSIYHVPGPVPDAGDGDKREEIILVLSELPHPAWEADQTPVKGTVI